MITQFTLTTDQAERIDASDQPGQLIGSLQRRCWPHPDAGQWYFSGKWCDASTVERMRKAATKTKGRAK